MDTFKNHSGLFLPLYFHSKIKGYQEVKKNYIAFLMFQGEFEKEI